MLSLIVSASRTCLTRMEGAMPIPVSYDMVLSQARTETTNFFVPYSPSYSAPYHPCPLDRYGIYTEPRQVQFKLRASRHFEKTDETRKPINVCERPCRIVHEMLEEARWRAGVLLLEYKHSPNFVAAGDALALAAGGFAQPCPARTRGAEKWLGFGRCAHTNQLASGITNFPGQSA